MEKHSRIFVAGHNGLVGSAIVGCLQAGGNKNIIVRSRKECNLENQSAICTLLLVGKPGIFLANTKMGCILANYAYWVDSIRSNLMDRTSILFSSTHITI